MNQQILNGVGNNTQLSFLRREIQTSKVGFFEQKELYLWRICSVLTITSEKVLFFDMDGTIVGTNAANNAAYISAYHAIMGRNYDNVSNIRISRHTIKNIPNISCAKYNAIVAEKERIYSNYLNLIKPIGPIIKLVQQCAGKNAMYIITRSQRKRAIETLEHLDLLNYFDEVVCSDSNNKYKDAINILGINPKNVIAFENDINEIKKCIETGVLIENIIQVGDE